MEKQRIGHIAIPVLLAFLLGACTQSKPGTDGRGLPVNPPGPVSIVEEVEDLVIEASVNVGLCLLDPDFCSQVSLDVEEDCESAPQAERECCLAVASLEFQPEVLNPELDKRVDELRHEFTEFETRNGRRPLLPTDLEWIVKLNEEILEGLFEEMYGPSFIAISEPLIACEQSASRQEIQAMFETRVRTRYGHLFRLCLMQPACFSLPLDKQAPIEDVLTDQSWLPPGPEVQLGVDCGWIAGLQLAQIVCPQPPAVP